jgi:DnaJ-class molecular chaperone
MGQKDYYEILGVSRNADADAIKKAYRTLALKHHPDRNPGNKKAEETFKAVNQAYDALSDPKKKSLYDQFGEMGLREGFNADQFRQYQHAAGSGAGGVPFEDLFGGAGGDPSSIFEQFFGGGMGGAGVHVNMGGRRGGSRSREAVAGRDLESSVRIDLATAVRGGEVSISVHGTAVTVKIPPGTRSGQRLRLSGKGMPSPTNGRPGDLVLAIQVNEHPSFWIEGNDLHVRIPVTIPEAWRGARVKVPTPTGDVTVRVPAHTNSGAKLRLKGKGMPHAKGGEAGDLLGHIEIVLPADGASLDDAMQAIEHAHTTDPRAELKF